MIEKFQGELEIDRDRGVIYFHLSSEKDIARLQAHTLLRICSLPAIPVLNGMLDITHMQGLSWKQYHELST